MERTPPAPAFAAFAGAAFVARFGGAVAFSAAAFFSVAFLSSASFTAARRASSASTRARPTARSRQRSSAASTIVQGVSAASVVRMRALGDLHEGVVVAEVLPVEARDLETGLGVLLELLQPLPLRVLREVEPALHEERAVPRELLLEEGDAREVGLEARVADLPGRPLQDRLGVPGAEEDPDPPARGEGPPEAPRRGAVALLVGPRAEDVRLDAARVEPLEEAVDGVPLAGAVGAGDDDDHGDLRLQERELRGEEACADRRELRRVLFLRELPSQLGRLEHDLLPAGRPAGEMRERKEEARRR